MLLREWFDHFWRYRSVDWAGAFLDEWCVQVMRSRIDQRHGPTGGDAVQSVAIAQALDDAVAIGSSKAGPRRSFVRPLLLY